MSPSKRPAPLAPAVVPASAPAPSSTVRPRQGAGAGPDLPSGIIAQPSPPLLSQHTRLASFRETKIKLASFSSIMRDRTRLPPGQIVESDRADTKAPPDGRVVHLHAPTQRARPGKSASPHRPMSLRSSSLATPPRPPTFRPISQTESLISEQSIISAASIVSTKESVSSLQPPSTTDASTTNIEFSNLFTPPATEPSPPEYASSVTSTKSSESHSKRERVMGLRTDPVITLGHAAGSKVFLPPNMAEILPFASTRAFSAWDMPAARVSTTGTDKASSASGSVISGGKARRGSVILARMQTTVEEEEFAGRWKELLRTRGGAGGKKVWVDAAGEEVGGVYRVGWERAILDLEARLHETMYDVAGERHTFVDLKDDQPPRAVLDIGTGAGLWPISQALIWPETSFVGLDLVPVQTDLGVLAAAERKARSTSDGIAPGEGMWESVQRRITWDRANFLETLPYDSGVFDMVHIRFVALGVPEAKWSDLLEECTRVLRPGGHLEIVETSLHLPLSSPASLRNSFASMLLADMVSPLPSLPIKFALPLVSNLAGGTIPIFERTWDDDQVPGALGDVVVGWVKSAREYKGTGTGNGTKKGRRDRVVEKVRRELAWANENKWAIFKGDGDGVSNVSTAAAPGSPFEVEGEEAKKTAAAGAGASDGGVSVWAWVAVKK